MRKNQAYRFWCQIQAVRMMSSSWVYFGFQPSSRMAFCGAGHQHRGVAGAAGMNFGRNGMAGDAAGRLDDFAHAETLPIAKVEDEGVCVRDRSASLAAHPEPAGARRPGRRRGCSRECRCRRGWGSRRRRCGSTAAAQGDIENQRNQMRLRLVGFAAGDARSGPSGAPATLK